jgi:uncharacterized protein (DUF1499 family)
MGRMFVYGLILLAVLALGIGTYVRLAPSDANALHVDPGTVTSANPRNSWLVAEGGNAPPVLLALPPETVAMRIADIAANTPRTYLLAGDGLQTTWITRSALMGFPDYTSVWIAPAPGGGSQITIYARSRFGDGDLGVNRARVDAWLGQLSQ